MIGQLWGSPILISNRYWELALSPGVKWPEDGADNSTPSSVEIKNVWSFTSITPIHLHGMVLKHRDNYFTFISKI
jgi:hypothetical protein